LYLFYIRLPSHNYSTHIARLESKLAEQKAEYGLRIVKWEDVPTPSRKLESYKALVRYAASLHTHVKSKCLVVDTQILTNIRNHKLQSSKAR
jgi:hypothetical protein